MTRDKGHTFISRHRSFNVYYKLIMQPKTYWTGMIVKLKMATTKSKHLQLYLLTLNNPTSCLRTDTCGGTDSNITRKAFREMLQ